MSAPIVLPFGADSIERAAALIRAGDIVAVTTETVYGLAADAGDAGAVARIYAAKGRPSFNPLIVHVTDLVVAEALAVFDDEAHALARRFWPGPLTLVLPLRADARIAAAVTAGLDTIAIRVPAHRAIRALLAATGRPLAAPSANRSNAISPTCAGHVVASLGASVPLVIDDGDCPDGVESTIVRGRDVLRPGPISGGMLFGDVRLHRYATLHPAEGRVSVAVVGAGRSTPGERSVTGPRLSPAWTQSGVVTAPGQLARHYAPAKPLRLNATHAAPEEWLIGFGAITGDDTLSATGDLREAATRLFAALHRADASASIRIAVAPIPNEGLGEAIADRLARAAHR